MKYDDIIISYGLYKPKDNGDLPTIIIAGIKDDITKVLKVVQGGEGVIKISDYDLK